MTDQFENFDRAFSTGFGGCRRKCECGKTFYNSSGEWDWEEGEIEDLEARDNAFDVDFTVDTVQFGEVEYVGACDCWHEEAKKVMNWICSFNSQIADFLKLEKDRKQAEADRSPTVE